MKKYSVSFKSVLFVTCLCALTSCSRNREVNSIDTIDSALLHSKVMRDGKRWLTTNLTVKTESIYCPQEKDSLCKSFGQLYTWEVAQHVCNSLGASWRLPTNEEWHQMIRMYDGVYDDSANHGTTAYKKLNYLRLEAEGLCSDWKSA